jgi:hypothetical protein
VKRVRVADFIDPSTSNKIAPAEIHAINLKYFPQFEFPYFNLTTGINIFTAARTLNLPQIGFKKI